MGIEKRTEKLSCRVCPGILRDAQAKLAEENARAYATAKNKRYATKKTLADIVEQALIEYVSEE